MKLQLQNYQGHSNTIIEAAPVGITAITGPSDSGKTSIIRACRLVLTNRPLGTAYIKHGTDSCLVKWDTVSRIRNKDLNGYEIDGVPGHLAAIRDIPQQVLDALNFGEDNIQDQHNSVFLLADSPGKVAAKLSNLVDLDVTIRTLKLIKQRRKDCSSRMNALAINISECERKLHTLKDVPQAAMALAVLEAKNAHTATLKLNHATVLACIKTALERKNDLLRMPNTSMLPELKSLVQRIHAVYASKRQADTLLTLISNAVECKKRLAISPRTLLTKVREHIGSVKVLRQSMKTLQNVKDAQKRSRILGRDVRVLTKQKKELMGNTCPLCGSALNA